MWLVRDCLWIVGRLIYLTGKEERQPTGIRNFVHKSSCILCFSNRVPSIGRWRLTAYARRSPFGSEDSCVGWPRVVEGEGAQIASVED